MIMPPMAINLQIMDFKNSIPATSCQNDDGSYSIFINTRLTKERQTDAYLHELSHIMRLDFEKKHEDVDIVENYAHRLDRLLG